MEKTSVIRPDLISPGAYLILFLGESLISQPSGEVHTPVWSQAFMGPVGHSDPQYEGSPMEADSFWRCTGSAGVRPSVESGKDTKAKELIPCPRNAPTARQHPQAQRRPVGGSLHRWLQPRNRQAHHQKCPGKTQTECKAKLAAAMEASKGVDVSHTDEYTVATWLRSWYDIYAKPNVRAATADRYRLMIEQYAIPRIGGIKLTKLTAHDLQKLYKELMESGRTNRKSGHGNPGLSSATVRSLHLMLHNALHRAVKERLILRNPTEDCIAPKVQKFEMQILQPEHIKTYLDAAEKRGLLPMFYLELVSGLRKGELTALLWSDPDITNRTISVSKQYVKNPNGELTLSRPKTETSVRKVSVPQEAVDLLVAEHKRHPNNPYMFPSPITREMYHPDSIVNLHKKILKDAGLPHIRSHNLRHTFATLALQNGVDVKTVSSMLGHYDAGFTLRTYTHATRQKQDEAAQTMGSFMAQVM